MGEAPRTSPLPPGVSVSSSLPQQPSSGPPAAAVLPVFANAPQFAFHTEAWLFSVSPESAFPVQLERESGIEVFSQSTTYGLV